MRKKKKQTHLKPDFACNSVIEERMVALKHLNF